VLASLGSSNVEVRLADGSRGVEGEPPFDRIIVTAAALRVPEPLLRQLAPGGRMVIPIGAPEEVQYLHLLTKGTEGAVVDRELFAVRFVPLRSAGDAGALHFAQ
jgi:protein-L-isoaspartate(D-aspartate) O-methyltransferase